MAQTLKFKQIAKDRLFYDQWQYCITFLLDEVTCLKTLDHEYIDAVLERRKLWREVTQQRWQTVAGTPGGKAKLAQTIMSRRWRDITEETSTNIHKLADLLINTRTEYKIVTSVDQCWVYTNNISLIKKLSAMSELTYKEYTEAVIVRPKNTIKLQYPKHAQRSYIKGRKLTPQEKENLKNFFQNQKESIRVSPAFQEWFNGSFHRSQDYFFIDHTGESWLVMLALVSPGIIRKTVEIIQA
jgi:hypothetical protein